MATIRPEFAFKVPTPLLGAGGVNEALLEAGGLLVVVCVKVEGGVDATDVTEDTPVAVPVVGPVPVPVPVSVVGVEDVDGAELVRGVLELVEGTAGASVVEVAGEVLSEAGGVGVESDSIGGALEDCVTKVV